MNGPIVRRSDDEGVRLQAGAARPGGSAEPGATGDDVGAEQGSAATAAVDAAFKALLRSLLVERYGHPLMIENPTGRLAHRRAAPFTAG